jgi:hypothetical protein
MVSPKQQETEKLKVFARMLPSIIQRRGQRSIVITVSCTTERNFWGKQWDRRREEQDKQRHVYTKYENLLGSIPAVSHGVARHGATQKSCFV